VRYDSFRHHRRSIRLRGYDYSSTGQYFVTICANGHLPLFDSDNARSIINSAWHALPIRFPHTHLDEFVIMPNHVHGIIVIDRRGELHVRPDRSAVGQSGTPPNSLSRIIQAFKSITTQQYTHAVKEALVEPFDRRLWQRNYYERIIRNEDELDRVQKYIRDNTLNWESDPENQDLFPCRGEPCVRPERLRPNVRSRI